MLLFHNITALNENIHAGKSKKAVFFGNFLDIRPGREYIVRRIMEKQEIIIIGAGNAATVFALNLAKRGLGPARIVARNAARAEALAARAKCPWSTDFTDLGTPEAVVISAVKDSADVELWSKCPFGSRLVLHTSGTQGLETLAPFAVNYGVLYPLQTLSKARELDLTRVPLLIEANTPENLARIRVLAGKLSSHVLEKDSLSRRKLHLAAVFANNFANLMFRMAREIAEDTGVDPGLLQPLIDETAEKLHTMDPDEAQTGPAVRWDENIMREHLRMLAGKPELAELYRNLSEAIHQRSRK